MPIVDGPGGLKIRIYSGVTRYAIARRIKPTASRPDEDLETVALYKDVAGAEGMARQTLEWLQSRHPREEYIFEDFEALALRMSNDLIAEEVERQAAIEAYNKGVAKGGEE